MDTFPVSPLERSCELAVDCEEAERRGRDSCPVTSHLSAAKLRQALFISSPHSNRRKHYQPQGEAWVQVLAETYRHCKFIVYLHPTPRLGAPESLHPWGVPGSPPHTLQARRTATPALPPALPSCDTSLKGHSQKSFS